MGICAEALVDIYPCTVDAFFAHPDSAALLDEYAAESSIAGMPPPRPNKSQYQAIEQAGVGQLICAFDGEAMIGFLYLLVALNPHYSAVIGVVESFFVTPSRRATGAGLRLLHDAEDMAHRRGAVGFLVSAPYGGRLADVLHALSGIYRETNRIFFRRLA